MYRIFLGLVWYLTGYEVDPILNISSSTRCTAYYNGTTNEVLEMHCVKCTMQLDCISKPTTSLYSDS